MNGNGESITSAFRRKLVSIIGTQVFWYSSGDWGIPLKKRRLKESISTAPVAGRMSRAHRGWIRSSRKKIQRERRAVGIPTMTAMRSPLASIAVYCP